MTTLHDDRHDAVLAAVFAHGACSVLDLGCGEGELLVRLIRDERIARAVGIDIDAAALTRLRARLRDEAPDVAAKATLIHGSMTEAGAGLAGFDAAILVETIEHLDPARLSLLERALFRALRPGVAIITTPNADFNGLLGVPSHRFRHPGHRFEWGRAKFQAWSEGAAARHGYSVAIIGVAGAHPTHGSPTQMAVFSRTVTA